LFPTLLAGPHDAEPAAEDLLVAPEVVGAPGGLDPEPAVFTAPRLAFLEHDHARHGLGALEVADVVALDAERRPGQPEGIGQLLQRRERLSLVGPAASLLP